MTKKVCVGIDGSDFSRAALMYGADEASVRSATLKLVCVFTPMYVSGGFESLAHADAISVCETMLEEEAIIVRQKYPDMDIETEVVIGQPVSALIEQSHDAALLVVGARGLGPIKNVVLGSVSRRVSHGAKCPVLIVSAPEYREITGYVVGLSAHGEQAALEFACSQANIHNKPLRGIHGRGSVEKNLLFSLRGYEADVQEQSEAVEIDVRNRWNDVVRQYPNIRAEFTTSNHHAFYSLEENAGHSDVIVIGRNDANFSLTHGFGTVTTQLLNNMEKNNFVCIVPHGKKK